MTLNRNGETFTRRQLVSLMIVASALFVTTHSFAADSSSTRSGGVWTQPILGRAADVWGYAPTYLMSAAISALAVLP
jgi:hypothetical protein